MKKIPAACDYKRRSFLRLSGLLGLGVASATLLPVEKAESVLFRKNEYKVSQTRTAMGTFVDMTVVHDSRDQAEQALGLAFAEVDRLCALLTRYGSQSPVCELNAENKLAQPGFIPLDTRPLCTGLFYQYYGICEKIIAQFVGFFVRKIRIICNILLFAAVHRNVHILWQNLPKPIQYLCYPLAI